MPVSYAEAEKLPYNVYKVLVWVRLVNHWNEYKELTDETDEKRIAFAKERITACNLHLHHWKSVASPNEIKTAMRMVKELQQRVSR